MKNILLIFTFVPFIAFGQVADIDKNTNKTVKIGEQEWMSENLNAGHFRNGSPITEAKSNEEWIKYVKAGQAAWCYYENDAENGKKYGKVYNWYAVNDPRGLAPEGWHIPSDEEWTKLIDYLGGWKVAGSKMKSTSGWTEDGNGSNESGFLGLPGGYRDDNNGSCANIGNDGYWWSSTELGKGSAWSRALDYNDDNIDRHGNHKDYGFSVRCIRN